MPRKFKFCVRCRRTIAENEVERGLFVQTPNGMLCATCAQQLDEETEAAKKPAAANQPPAPKVEEKSAPIPPVPPKEEAASEPPSIPHSVLRTPHSEAPAAPADPPMPPADPRPGASEPAAQHLAGIRELLEAIHRTLVFEKSSPWNVLATVAQCLAVGMLIIAAVNWIDRPLHMLLVALIFQVMALTFFVRGK